MRLNTWKFGCLGLVVLSLTAGSSTQAAEKIPANATHVVIGIPETLFQGIPPWLIKAGADPFKRMMKANTGVDGSLQFPPDTLTLAEAIQQGKIQLGVMQGHEYAWSRTKYPELVPIAVAVPMQPVQSYCVVRWDCTASNIGDLKNGKISIPPIHRDFCEMFLSKIKDEHMKGQMFAGQLNAGTSSEAIDHVIDGKSECAVVDCATLKFYEAVFPGPFKATKVLCESEVFPNACIVVKKGELDDKTIEKFIRALLHAQDDPVGRPMLVTWKLKGFARVPDDYSQQIKNIEKSYPTPSMWRASIDK